MRLELHRSQNKFLRLVCRECPRLSQKVLSIDLNDRPFVWSDDSTTQGYVNARTIFELKLSIDIRNRKAANIRILDLIVEMQEEILVREGTHQDINLQESKCLSR